MKEFECEHDWNLSAGMTEAAHGACRCSILFINGAVMRENLAISEATSQEKAGNKFSELTCEFP